MALKKKPVTGMKDILPAEMQIRDYVLNQIKRLTAASDFPRSRLRAWSTLRTSLANRAATMRN